MDGIKESFANSRRIQKFKPKTEFERLVQTQCKSNYKRPQSTLTKSRPSIRQNMSRWKFTDANKKFRNQMYGSQDNDSSTFTVNPTKNTARPSSSTCKRTNHFYIGIERKILNAEYQDTAIIPHTKLKDKINKMNDEMLEQV